MSGAPPWGGEEPRGNGILPPPPARETQGVPTLQVAAAVCRNPEENGTAGQNKSLWFHARESGTVQEIMHPQSFVPSAFPLRTRRSASLPVESAPGGSRFRATLWVGNVWEVAEILGSSGIIVDGGMAKRLWRDIWRMESARAFAPLREGGVARRKMACGLRERSGRKGRRGGVLRVAVDAGFRMVHLRRD